MQNKTRDIMYCGVDRSRVTSGHPLVSWDNMRLFMYYIRERYLIHIRKDVDHQPAPWTDDPILQRYRFTNVRREHDRQSRRLITMIVENPDLTLEDRIANIFLFRAWNNADTFSLLGLPQPAQAIYSPGLKEIARKIYCILPESEQRNRMWYSSAYNQGGSKMSWRFSDGERHSFSEPGGEPIIPLRPFHVGLWLGRDRVIDRMLSARNQKECFDVIRSVRGISDFLAYQIFVDCTYIPEFPFSENEFVVAGPGAKNGLRLLFRDSDGLTDEELIFFLRDWQDYILQAIDGSNHKKFSPLSLFSDLPMHDRYLNVMSLENCLCEFSKFHRAYNGSGRPRQLYDPSIIPMP